MSAGLLGALVPDIPSAEPMADLRAQIADMRDPKTPRRAVYLSPANVQAHGADVIAKLADGHTQLRDFDGKGGVLIVPDAQTAQHALQLRANLPMQKVLGALTGAGDGKTIADTVIVQGRTPTGAVATEGMLRPDEVPGRVAQVRAQGLLPAVLTHLQAQTRRARGLLDLARGGNG